MGLESKCANMISCTHTCTLRPGTWMTPHGEGVQRMKCATPAHFPAHLHTSFGTHIWERGRHAAERRNVHPSNNCAYRSKNPPKGVLPVNAQQISPDDIINRVIPGRMGGLW